MFDPATSLYKLRFIGPNRSKPFYITQRNLDNCVNAVTDFILNLVVVDRREHVDRSYWSRRREKLISEHIVNLSRNLKSFKQVGFRALQACEYNAPFLVRSDIKPECKEYAMKRFHISRNCKNVHKEMSKNRRRHRYVFGELFPRYYNRDNLVKQGYSEVSSLRCVDLLQDADINGVHQIDNTEFCHMLLRNTFAPMIENSLIYAKRIDHTEVLIATTDTLSEEDSMPTETSIADILVDIFDQKRTKPKYLDIDLGYLSYFNLYIETGVRDADGNPQIELVALLADGGLWGQVADRVEEYRDSLLPSEQKQQLTFCVGYNYPKGAAEFSKLFDEFLDAPSSTDREAEVKRTTKNLLGIIHSIRSYI